MCVCCKGAWHARGAPAGGRARGCVVLYLCVCLVFVWVCVCVFAVKEPGTREAHLLEVVQEGVWLCICVCVCFVFVWVCVCVYVCLLLRSLAHERRTCWRPYKRVCGCVFVCVFLYLCVCDCC